jgi:lipoprotein-anchoring transpeptidase ErfK/SrfK
MTTAAHSPRSGIAAGGAKPPIATGSLGSLLSPEPSARPDLTASHPLTSPCDHNQSAQVVVVSIKHQHMWACAGTNTVISTPVTTGASAHGDATPRGTFAIQGIDPNTTLTTSGGSSYHVRFWLPFRLGIWGFHDASWQTMPFGSKGYVTKGSHGCVHVPTAIMRQLFHWVRYGTKVRIR